MEAGDAGPEVGGGDGIGGVGLVGIFPLGRREEDLELVQVGVAEELAGHGAAEATDQAVVLVGPLILIGEVFITIESCNNVNSHLL